MLLSRQYLSWFCFICGKQWQAIVLFFMFLGSVTAMGMKDPTGPDYSLFLFNGKVLPVSPCYVLQEMEYLHSMIGNRASSGSLILPFRQCCKENSTSCWVDYFIPSCTLYEHSKYIRHENMLSQRYFYKYFLTSQHLFNLNNFLQVSTICDD